MALNIRSVTDDLSIRFEKQKKSIKSHTRKNALVLNHVTKVYQLNKGNSRAAKAKRDSEAQLVC